jgi:ERCC4-type nuclease
MKLQIDIHEPNDKLIQEIRSFFPPEDIEITTLSVGDLNYGNVCIELKRLDLISSLKTNKGATTSNLKRQAQNMMQFPVRAVIVTRTIPEIFMDSKFIKINHPELETEPFDFRKLTGYLASLFVRHGVPVFPFGEYTPINYNGRIISAVSYFIYSILIKGNDNRSPIINPIRVHASPSQEQEAVLQSIMNIGPETSKLLLSHFGSALAVFNASQSELESIKGIGPKTSSQIFSLLRRPYIPELQKEKTPSLPIPLPIHIVKPLTPVTDVI